MNHLHKIDPVDLGLLMLGTLLFNGEGQLEPVKSQLFIVWKRRIPSDGAFLEKSMGGPSLNFFMCP